jgi:hypothetical protein
LIIAKKRYFVIVCTFLEVLTRKINAEVNGNLNHQTATRKIKNSQHKINPKEQKPKK